MKIGRRNEDRHASGKQPVVLIRVNNDASGFAHQPGLINKTSLIMRSGPGALAGLREVIKSKISVGETGGQSGRV